jgi:phosphoribosylformylglycinamidine (FGAM) synthase-like enzyme
MGLLDRLRNTALNTADEIVASFNAAAAHGAGATDDCIVPLFAGTVSLYASTESATTDMTIEIYDYSDQSISNPTSAAMLTFVSNSDGVINEQFVLPRGNCLISMKNGNAAAQNQIWWLIANEY